MAVKKRWYQWKVRRDHARDQQRQGGRQILLRSQLFNQTGSLEVRGTQSPLLESGPQ